MSQRQTNKDEDDANVDNLTLTQPHSFLDTTDSVTANSSESADFLIKTQTVISGFYKNVTEEILNTTSLDLTPSTENGTMASNINMTLTTLHLPNDSATHPCSVLKEYGTWKFQYKYTPEEIRKLVCHCKGMCLDLTLSPDIQKQVHNDVYGPLSERNKPAFIAIVTVYSFLLLVGLTGKFLFIVSLKMVCLFFCLFVFVVVVVVVVVFNLYRRLQYLLSVSLACQDSFVKMYIF